MLLVFFFDNIHKILKNSQYSEPHYTTSQKSHSSQLFNLHLNFWVPTHLWSTWKHPIIVDPLVIWHRTRMLNQTEQDCYFSPSQNQADIFFAILETNQNGWTETKPEAISIWHPAGTGTHNYCKALKLCVFTVTGILWLLHFVCLGFLAWCCLFTQIYAGPLNICKFHFEKFKKNVVQCLRCIRTCG